MTHTLPPWLDIVVRDLKAVASDLLEPGLAPALAVKAVAGQGPLLRSAMVMADRFVALLPRLLAEVETIEDTDAVARSVVRSPLNAKASLTPYDYGIHANRIVPLRWVRPEGENRPNSVALRWVLHVCQEIRLQLETHSLRLRRQLDEALLVRAGQSEWAAQDSHTLQNLGAEAQQRVTAIARAESHIKLLSGRRIHPSQQMPMPFPQQPAWQRLKQLARSLLRPEEDLRFFLSEILHDPIRIADVPFLYQRWCGLQLLQALERHGWTRQTSVLGPLFLGGVISLEKPASVGIRVWVEPRISRATTELTGWGCAELKDELTPDFLVCSGDAGDRDAFVLDATLATSDELLRSKARYRSQLVGSDVSFVAGVPVSRRPIRAWAVSPIGGAMCRLHDPEGRSGAIPLRPDTKDARALDAWVADVSEHARRQRAVLPA